jgi:hypothetical protein
MKRKKFKTVAGYLRSKAERIRESNLPKEQAAQRAAVYAGQRTAINNLLPQLGFSNLIGPTEAPHEGVERLLKLNLNEQQTAALKTCQRWLKNFSVAHWVVTTSASPPVEFRTGGQTRMIVAGESFTHAETEAMEAIQRARKTTITEAIALFREGAA